MWVRVPESGLCPAAPPSCLFLIWKAKLPDGSVPPAVGVAYRYLCASSEHTLQGESCVLQASVSMMQGLNPAQ